MKLEVDFGHHTSSLFLQKVIIASPVADCKSCEISSVFVQTALLRSSSDHDVLIVALHHVFGLICFLEKKFEDVDVQVVCLVTI